MNTKTKEDWQRQLVSALPPEEDIRRRNEAISARYARWYLDHPDWFRWAGMAAFASHRVGLLLSMYDFAFEGNKIVDVEETYEAIDHDKFLANLELLREANNRAFENSGWAHLAYESPDGGVAAVEAGLADDPTQQYLLQGFREIELGRRARATAPEVAERHFWKAGLLHLHHEQWGVIQNHFARMNSTLGLALTVITVLEFTANQLVENRRNRCAFFWFMWLRGWLVLLRTLSLPDIRKIEHRWTWIQNQVFPTWKKVARRDRLLKQKLDAIVRAAK